MPEYRWRDFNKYDTMGCVVIVAFVLYSALKLNEPVLITIMKGLVLLSLFLGGSRIVIIESNKTSKEESI